MPNANETISAEPLWKLQRRALVDADAARECGRRHALNTAYCEEGGTYFNRIVAEYVRGLNGEESEWKHGKGGNFAKPLTRAHREGAKLRRELMTDSVIQKPGEITNLELANRKQS